MQRAAAGLAAACAGLLGRVYGSRVVLLVGSGDNGGDALYAGARLARRGAGVTAVLLTPERAHAAGLAALLRAGGRAVDADAEPAAGAASGPVSGPASRPVSGPASRPASGPASRPAAEAGVGAVEEAILRADLVVDGIVGIGGKGGLRPGA